MKYLLLLSAAIAVSTAGVIEDPIQGYKDGDRFFFFAEDNEGGVLHLIDAEEPIDQVFLSGNGRNPNNNQYLLYTRANPITAQALVFNDVVSVFNSNFDPSKPTTILVHGWNGNGANPLNTRLTAAFLEDGDVNVIVLDWNRLANRNYITAKNGVAAVGRRLGEFINFLASLGMSYDTVHLVGHSLGAHLVGNAGRETGSKVRRITGLDAAAPLWGGDSNRLLETDAQYVEVIHTNTALLGWGDPQGHADFYPNGGSRMPGCYTLSSCSHSRSWEYMEASVRYNHFVANECATLREATRNNCRGLPYHMGNSDINKFRNGIFRVNTGRSFPF